MSLPDLVPQWLTHFICAVNRAIIFQLKIQLGGSMKSIVKSNPTPQVQSYEYLGIHVDRISMSTGCSQLLKRTYFLC